MSYVVVIRVQVEGDLSEYERLLDEFRQDSLLRVEEMEQFMVCTVTDEENAYLIVQTFASAEAHEKHMNSAVVQEFLEGLQDYDLKMGVIMMMGQEIEYAADPLLN